MEVPPTDQQVWLEAFQFLTRLVDSHGEVLPLDAMRQDFDFRGRRVPLLGPQGIFKPAVLDWPLSITTVPVVHGRARPYDDGLGGSGFLQYRYRGGAAGYRDNRGLCGRSFAAAFR